MLVIVAIKRKNFDGRYLNVDKDVAEGGSSLYYIEEKKSQHHLEVSCLGLNALEEDMRM